MRRRSVRCEHMGCTNGQRRKDGDKLVMRLKRQDTARYKGTAHDPSAGLTYSMTVKTSETSMQSQGCVLAGLACRSMGWTRLR